MPPGPPRARLFVALELPEDARAGLVEWRAEALHGRAGLRAVAPESLHVTLVFLGHRPEHEVPGIGDTVARAVAGMAPVRLRPLRAASIPPRRPRLVALSLEDDRGRAAAIQSALSAELQAGGFHVPEKRPFWPHVTLARVGRGVRAEPIDVEAPEGSWEASQVTLYRSRLSPRGARYEGLRGVGLG